MAERVEFATGLTETIHAQSGRCFRNLEGKLSWLISNGKTDSPGAYYRRCGVGTHMTLTDYCIADLDFFGSN
jgi:hypothetical protein